MLKKEKGKENEAPRVNTRGIFSTLFGGAESAEAPLSGAKVDKKIVLTGGHAATTALAVYEELTRRIIDKKRWDIYFIGSAYAVEGLKIPTLEATIFSKIGVPFHTIITGRVQRKITFWTIPSLLKIPIGFLHAFYLLFKIKPDIIVSFGGFAAFPVVVMGWVLRIPIIIHEQTASIGRANLFSSPFASLIAVARYQSVKYFPKKKVKVVGNPVLSNVISTPPKQKIGNPPVIYITGGSRGSQPLNNVVKEILKDLLRKYKVIHHTGYFDYPKFIKIRNSLEYDLKERYIVHEIIDPFDIAGIYKKSDIIISRAGANTVSEIIIAKLPAILIPIPFSYKNEQTKNAQIAQKYGLARILTQDNLSKESLNNEINWVIHNWRNINKSAENKKSPDLYAAQKLVNFIELTRL